MQVIVQIYKRNRVNIVMNTILVNLYQFFKREAVLCIAAIVSLITMFFVPVSAKYIDYIDFRVLSLLFCLMAVVAGYKKTGVFQFLAEKLLRRTADTRTLCLVLIMLCFFTSMLITNDVALITFVPFSIMLLSLTGKEKLLIPVIVLQTIAANLGSMLTPVGNPQNLYLYTYYGIPAKTFFIITLPVAVVSFLLLTLSVFFIKKAKIKCQQYNHKLKIHPMQQPGHPMKASDNKKLILLYSLLFLLCLACVLRLFDYKVMLCIVFISIFMFDRIIFKKIDYLLLLTFVCFFIFVGNIGNIPAIHGFLKSLIHHREFFSALVLSQCISNVPAAVLLSAFTNNYKALILGTDIGGLGTLVASLASIISYKLYCQTDASRPGKYLIVFTLINIAFLCLLYLIFYFI